MIQAAHGLKGKQFQKAPPGRSKNNTEPGLGQPQGNSRKATLGNNASPDAHTRAELGGRLALEQRVDECLDVAKRQLPQLHEGRGGLADHLAVRPEHDEPIATKLPPLGHVLLVRDERYNGGTAK